MKQIVARYLPLLLLALTTSAHAYGVNYAASGAHQELMSAEEAKFAFVDVQEILTRSTAGKEAKAKLDSAVLQAETEIKARESKLNRLKAELKENAQSLEVKGSATREVFEEKLQEYQLFVSKVTEGLRAENTELTKGVVEKILKVVQEYGRRKGFLCIFFKNESMLYLDNKVDITGAILQEVNQLQMSGWQPSPDPKVSQRP